MNPYPTGTPCIITWAIPDYLYLIGERVVVGSGFWVKGEVIGKRWQIIMDSQEIDREFGRNPPPQIPTAYPIAWMQPEENFIVDDDVDAVEKAYQSVVNSC